jgi:tetratricopeptide (TPR) repeat protein
MRIDSFERRGDPLRSNNTTYDAAYERYARGDLDSARRLLEDRRDPHDVRTTFLYAEILIRMRIGERAERILRDAMPERDPRDSVRAHHLLASAAISRGDLASAESALDVACANQRARVEREEEALYRASIAHRRGDAKAFRDQLKTACGSADPALNARAHLLGGNVLQQQGRFVEAYAEHSLGLSALYSARAIDDRLLAHLLIAVSFAESELETTEHMSALRAIDGRDWHPVMTPHVAIALTHAGLSLARHGRFAEAAAVYLRSTLVGGESANTVLALVRSRTDSIGRRCTRRGSTRSFRS